MLNQIEQERTTPKHNMAVYSVCLYIILATMFEESKIGYARLASVGIIICLGACVISIFRNRIIQIGWLEKTLLIFGAFITIGCLYSPTSNSLLSIYLYRYWTTFVLVFVVSNTIKESGDISKLLNAYIIAGVLLSVYMYSYYGIQHLTSLSSRLTGELGNQNTLGISCACAVLLSIIFATINHSTKRILYIVAAVIPFPACLFSASRKAILLIAVGVFLFFLIYGKRKRFVIRIALAIILLFTMYRVIKNIPAFSVIYSRLDELFLMFTDKGNPINTSDLHRMEYIEVGWNEFLKRPIFGNGFLYSYSIFGTYSHNNIIEILMNHGLLGFSIYYYSYFRMIREAGKKGFNSISSALTVTILLVLIFLDIGSVNYYSRYTLLLICICSKLQSIETREGLK